MRILKRLGLSALALLAVAITVAVLAPAQWLASALARASDGRVALAEVQGSFWNGQGTLVLTSKAGSRASLPERLSWRVSPRALLTGRIDATFSHPSALVQPLHVQATPDGKTRVGATTLRLPAIVLVGLGAPWNTLRPGGTISVSWNQLLIDAGRIHGNIIAEWQFASSAMTPVSPFGHYRLQTAGLLPGSQLKLTTISGPLELAGVGTISEGGHLRFRGRAQPMSGTDELVKSQLTGLLSLLGRRDGEAAILSIGN